MGNTVLSKRSAADLHRYYLSYHLLSEKTLTSPSVASNPSSLKNSTKYISSARPSAFSRAIISGCQRGALPLTFSTRALCGESSSRTTPIARTPTRPHEPHYSAHTGLPPSSHHSPLLHLATHHRRRESCYAPIYLQMIDGKLGLFGITSKWQCNLAFPSIYLCICTWYGGVPWK